MEFEIGDVVKLKSGGPAMTIQQIGNWTYLSVDGSNTREDEAKCFWFEGSKRSEGCFNLASLEKVEQ